MATTYGKPHEHIPKANPVIPRRTVDLAHKVLQARMSGEPHPITGEKVTRDEAVAATDLLKLYQTQDRYSPERVKQLAASPKASEAIRDLATLTEDELNAMTAQMAAEAGHTLPN